MANPHTRLSSTMRAKAHANAENDRHDRPGWNITPMLETVTIMIKVAVAYAARAIAESEFQTPIMQVISSTTENVKSTKFRNIKRMQPDPATRNLVIRTRKEATHMCMRQANLSTVESTRRHPFSTDEYGTLTRRFY